MVPLSATVLSAAAQPPVLVPGDCRNDAVSDIGPLLLFQEDLATGSARCLSLRMLPGEMVRTVFEIGVIPPLAGAALERFEPGDNIPALRVDLGTVNRQVLRWEGMIEGLHHLVVRDTRSIDRDVDVGPTRVWAEAVEPPFLVQAR